MHTLHIVSKSPTHPRFRECLGMVSPEDAVFLTGNGVVALSDSRVSLPLNLYALSDDMAARAVEQTSHPCTPIGFDTMVDMTLQAQRIISW